MNFIIEFENPAPTKFQLFAHVATIIFQLLLLKFLISNTFSNTFSHFFFLSKVVTSFLFFSTFFSTLLGTNSLSLCLPVSLSVRRNQPSPFPHPFLPLGPNPSLSEDLLFQRNCLRLTWVFTLGIEPSPSHCPFRLCPPPSSILPPVQ